MKKIVIFGASGDLAKRKILPSISKIPNKNVQVYGYARTEFGGKYSEEIRKFYEYNDDFPERVIYIKGEYSCLDKLKGILDENTLVYLSLPPHVHHNVLQELKLFNFGIAYIEKPFGENKHSFDQLLEFKSEKIKFIDHYLLKPMMVSIAEIKKKISTVHQKLSNSNIKSVDCFFIESILAEGRSYFDRNGIVKDVMQNHLVEMVASILCGDSRIEFIKEMHIDDGEYVFGQYKQYREEVGYESQTETLSAFKCYSTGDSWREVPFFMVGGKGLSKKASEIKFNVREDRFAEFSEYIPKNIPEIKSISVIFNIAPKNQISIEIVSSNECIETVILGSEEILQMSTAKVGASQDYEIIFGTFLNERPLPNVSFEEAEELWRLFDGILSAEKNLIYYDVGDDIATRLSSGLLKK